MSGPFSLNKKNVSESIWVITSFSSTSHHLKKNMVLKAARLFRKLRADTYGDLLPTMIIATAQTLGLLKLGWIFV